MILTTTPSIEGKTISEYRGIVTGEAILGANLFRDFFAGVRDIVGGRSASYEKELHQAREIALKELHDEAEILRVGANPMPRVVRRDDRRGGILGGRRLHTAVGKVSGRGGPLTNRSGCAV